MNQPTQVIPPDYKIQTVWLNASSLKKISCQRRYNWTVVRGLRDKETAEALTFGTAVHKYAERRFKGSSAPTALQEAFAVYKGVNTQQLSAACLSMPANLITPYADDIGPFIERKFEIFWRDVVVDNIKIIFRVMLVGTIDALTVWSDGAVEIVDWKTTRKYKAAEVYANYRVSVQMQFYLWVLYKFGYAILPFELANRTAAGHLFLRIGAAFITQNPPRWHFGAPVQLSPLELDDFGAKLELYLHSHIIPAWLNDSPEGKLNDTCHNGERSGALCEFAEACHARSDVEFNQALATFDTTTYDPRRF
jgi:hypothetical protein